MPREIHYTTLLLSLLTGALATLIAMALLAGRGSPVPGDAAAPERGGGATAGEPRGS